MVDTVALVIDAADLPSSSAAVEDAAVAVAAVVTRMPALQCLLEQDERSSHLISSAVDQDSMGAC